MRDERSAADEFGDGRAVPIDPTLFASIFAHPPATDAPWPGAYGQFVSMQPVGCSTRSQNAQHCRHSLDCAIGRAWLIPKV